MGFFWQAEDAAQGTCSTPFYTASGCCRPCCPYTSSSLPVLVCPHLPVFGLGLCEHNRQARGDLVCKDFVLPLLAAGEGQEQCLDPHLLSTPHRELSSKNHHPAQLPGSRGHRDAEPQGPSPTTPLHSRPALSRH